MGEVPDDVQALIAFVAELLRPVQREQVRSPAGGIVKRCRCSSSQPIASWMATWRSQKVESPGTSIVRQISGSRS
jgi:hypothetical protein